MHARTVIIPAAGKGTRMMPATKVTAKELLPVYDRLAIDFAIEEAVGAGAERIVVVISSAKTSIRNYLGRDGFLSGHLSETQADGRVHSAPEVRYVFQDQPLGLGDAILRCRNAVLPGPVGIILPDDIITGENCLAEMVQNYEHGLMAAAMPVLPEEAGQYGIFKLGGSSTGRCIKVTGMVEKPTPGNAPSNLAAVGRYILDPMIFDVLDRTPPGKGGEVQLTDAIVIAANALPLVAFQFSGTRYDCGSHDGLVEASVARQKVVKKERGRIAVKVKLAQAPAAAFYDAPQSRLKGRERAAENAADTGAEARGQMYG